MFELLADAGPMTLPLWVVMALSAAMYPLGFLFGACSECCGAAGGCSRCTRAYDFCSAYQSITITFERGDFFDVTVINDNTYQSDCIEQQFFLLDEGFTACGNTYDVYARFEFNTSAGTNDESGCYKPFFSPILSLEFRGSGFTLFCGIANSPSFEMPSDCATTSATIELTTDKGCFIGNNCYEELTDYLTTLGDVTYEVTLNECDCGACCEAFAPEADVACSENVSENGCGFPPASSESDKYVDLLSSEWQGTGTGCNPSPCPALGACCLEDEDGVYCLPLFQSHCESSGGTWHAGSCDPSPC